MFSGCLYARIGRVLFFCLGGCLNASIVVVSLFSS